MTSPAHIKIYESNPLLDTGVILFPSEFSTEDVWDLKAALSIAFDLFTQPIVLFNGLGGTSDGCLAMCDMLKESNAIGIAYGGVSSAHSITWASCPDRYISERAVVGIHGVRSGIFDAPTVETDYRMNLQSTKVWNDIYAKIYADACASFYFNKPAYWKRMFTKIGMYHRAFSSQEIVDKYQMAKYSSGLSKELKQRLGVP